MPPALHLLPDLPPRPRPLDRVTLLGPPDTSVEVRDARGQTYALGHFGPDGRFTFTVGGALGRHTATAPGHEPAAFTVVADTDLRDDDGRFTRLFQQLRRTLLCDSPAGYSTLFYHGRPYHAYIHWILDHAHTAKGMQYIVADRDAEGRPVDPTASFLDLWQTVQRDDGMVYSNAFPAETNPYFMAALGPYGFAKVDGGLNFNRQPCENHNEYNYVETVHLAWKAHGDDAWMTDKLDSVLRALDYSVNDPLRFSRRFGLLKRGYTIDSWDFQVEDRYTVHFPLGTAQNISAETKFGIFFGDNHGYANACAAAAEMLDHAGRGAEAQRLRQREADVRRRLDAVAWNGRFFTHRVEEDDSVVRDLGVDEKTQVAMSNAYALNRGIPHEQAVAILRTYQQLRVSGAPEPLAEWYAIFPPFGRGFGKDSDRWQYMNGGVHGHAAGELARGAFEHGFETYGVDILLRLSDLAAAHPKGIVAFAYTGGHDPQPPPQQFQPIDLTAAANMDTASDGITPTRFLGSDAGNDLAALPVGLHRFAGSGDVPFLLADPASNGRRALLAVGPAAPGQPRSADLPVGRQAGALYLLHTAARTGPSGVAAVITLTYDDGSAAVHYLLRGRHVDGWWYPQLKRQDAGVAYLGRNRMTDGVGLCWCCLPLASEKTLAAVRVEAPADGGSYVLAALTLADRMPHRRADFLSYGGPDNWSGGTCMHALLQGLAGATDLATRFRHVRLSPRWTAAASRHVHVVVKYGVSDGYIAYDFHDDGHALRLTLTGGGQHVLLRLLLPHGKTATSVTLDGLPNAFRTDTVEASTYVVLDIPLTPPVRQVAVAYA